MTNRPLEYYMGLPYRVEIYPEEEGLTAIVPDLPGCMTCADTLDALWAAIREAKGLWLETALLEDMPIPEPPEMKPETYSGKFVVRIPRSLHRRLAERAAREGTSLNQLVLMLLSEGASRSGASLAKTRSMPSADAPLRVAEDKERYE
jgi:antitoxin HicB